MAANDCTSMGAHLRTSERGHQHRPQKRRRVSRRRVKSEIDDDSELGDDSGLDARSKRLGCHYYKRFPTQYTDCMLRHHLTSSSFAFQHLRRYHLPIYCPKCGQTFGETAEREEHVQERTCQDADLSPESPGSGHQDFDARQLVELHRCSGRGLGEEGRWYAVWDVLFPGANRPDTPYISNPENEILDMARRAMKLVYPNNTSLQFLDELDWSTVCSALERPSPDASHVQARSNTGSISSPGSPKPPAPSPRPMDPLPELPPPTRFKRHASSKLPNKILVCPFWKADPKRHRSCFRRTLSRVRDVKQHLARVHSPEFYCDRCSAIFPDGEAYRQHVSNPAGLLCTPSRQLDGISHLQRRQISCKSNPKLSEEGQWFAVWDVIFPSRSRPSSAYRDAGISEDLCSFREFYMACSENIFATQSKNILGSHLSAVFQKLSEEERQSILQWVAREGLELAFAAWVSGTDSKVEQSDRSTYDTAEDKSSLADSGISVRTQPPAADSPPDVIVKVGCSEPAEEGSSRAPQAAVGEREDGTSALTLPSWDEVIRSWEIGPCELDPALPLMTDRDEWEQFGGEGFL